MIRQPADIYFLTETQWQQLARTGSKTPARIMAGLEASKDRPLEKVLYALGIYRLDGRWPVFWPPATKTCPQS